MASLAAVVSGMADHGSVVLVSGEAGHGKTSLLEHFTDGLDHRFTVVRGACEPLGIPAPFAPLYDLIDQLPPELASDIRSGAGRPAIYAGLLDVLKNDNVVLVLEDVHWADEATLGLVRYLGRRIGPTGSVLIATYRSEEIDLNPQLRLVVADLGRDAVRIDLPALSVDAVATMVRGLDLDPVRVQAATLGNPFFVEEVIRHPELTVPPSVQNAVLANAAQLSEPARELVYMVALSPDGLGLDFITGAGPDAEAYVEMALRRLLLTASKNRVSCRHDLIRDSLLQSVSPLQSRALHRRLLANLENRVTGQADAARLAFHAVGAGDPPKAVEYSLQAAEDARRIGAHRQAAFHYDNALDFAETMSPETFDRVLLVAAVEHSIINAFEKAVSLSGRRIDLANDPVDEARARAWNAFFWSRLNDLPRCGEQAALAISVLSGVAECQELAVALAALAWKELVEGRPEQAIIHGDEAVRVAQATAIPQMEVHAKVTAGFARFLTGEPTGVDQIRQAADQGVGLDLGEFAARALNNLSLVPLHRGRPAEALEGFERLVEYTQARELDAWYIAAITTRAGLNLRLGRWDQVDLDLEVVEGQRTCRQTEIEAKVVAATLRARRDDPGARELVEDALAGAAGFGDLDAQVSVCALAMEAGWMGLIPTESASRLYSSLLQSPEFASNAGGVGLLGFWARRLGLEPASDRMPGPAGPGAGRASEAVQVWLAGGFPVESAIARANDPDGDLEAAVADLDRLGADGVLRGLRRELQRRGVERIPRGRRSATREHPAGLTPRQDEVLGLLASGLSNAAIAAELYISEKTVGHHVSAILQRLQVSSRLQAAALANAAKSSATTAVQTR